VPSSRALLCACNAHLTPFGLQWRSGAMNILVRAAAAPGLRCARAINAARVFFGQSDTQLLVLIFSTARVQERKRCFGSSREWGRKAQQPTLLSLTARAQDRSMRFCSSPFFGGFQPGAGERNTAACSHFFTARVQDGALFTGFVVRLQCPFDPFWPAMTKRCHEHLSARGCSS
jgi:hypothetical protein